MSLSALIALWAVRYDVESALEHVSGPAPSVCDALATRGVRVMTCRDGERLPDVHADLVVVHGGAPEVAWREWLVGLSRRASKLVIVATPDPERSRRMRFQHVLNTLLGRSRQTPPWGTTSALAPVLWEFGRVREHERLHDGEHAFVVDVTPRTPQARRKLRLAGSTG